MNTEQLYERALEVKSAIHIRGILGADRVSGAMFAFFCARQLYNSHTLA
jgi:hypothetical protein